MSPLRHLADQMAETFGLRARGNWRAEIERAAAVIASELHCTIDELPDRLGRSPVLAARFAGLLTIGETHFFRHPHHLDHLVQWLPDRLAESGGRLKIWSAGCATGEEPYSIAIAIDSRLGNETLERVRILGTDVDLESVNRARRATYRSWSFRGAPGWLLGTYFNAEDDGWARLRTAILRGAVQFESYGVFQRAIDTANESVEAIFFRNVAIYLEDQLLERLYKRFAEILVPGGLLFLGPSDPRPDGSVFAPSPLSDDRTVLSPRPAGHSYSPNLVPMEPPAPPFLWAGPSPLSATPAVPPSSPAPSSFSFFPTPISEHPSVPPPGPPATSAPGLPFSQPTAPVDAHSSASVPSPSSRPSSVPPPPDALTLANRLVEAEHSADAYALRAQIHFEAEAYDAAVADMRSAIFLRPNSPLNLYLYACMLERSAHPQRARSQLEAARSALKGLDPDFVLEDEETTAAQLRDAIELSLSRPSR